MQLSGIGIRIGIGIGIRIGIGIGIGIEWNHRQVDDEKRIISEISYLDGDGSQISTHYHGHAPGSLVLSLVSPPLHAGHVYAVGMLDVGMQHALFQEPKLVV